MILGLIKPSNISSLLKIICCLPLLAYAGASIIHCLYFNVYHCLSNKVYNAPLYHSISAIVESIVLLPFACRNPDKSRRPTFEAILRTLSEPEDQLVQWTREDTQTHPQCSLLGAPLDCGRDLYPSLQGMYL